MDTLTTLDIREYIAQEQSKIFKRADQTFIYLLSIEYIISIIIAFTLTPLTWQGAESSVNPHTYFAVFFGAVIITLPIFLSRKQEHTPLTRHVNVIAQCLMTSLFVHLLGGRIEAHFMYFVSLAFFSYYQDWKVIITATLVIATDHLVRAIVLPFSLYGSSQIQIWRVLEYATYVIIEDIVLIKMCLEAGKQMQEQARTVIRARQLEAEQIAIATEQANTITHIQELKAEQQRDAETFARSIEQLLPTVANLAEGDLTARFTTDSTNDSVLQLCTGLNHAIETIRELVLHVADIITATASSGEHIVSATEELSTQARIQTQNTADIRSALQTLSAIQHQTLTTIMSATSKAHTTREHASSGNAILERTMQSISNIADTVYMSSEQIGVLGDAGKHIGEVILTIEEIADQTNLLALNAAIEAARAGEQGRGFAVVADEVRKLAERTQKATKEIESMIGNLQRNTTTAVQSISSITAEVEKSKYVMTETSKAFNEIIDQIASVADAIEGSSSQSQHQEKESQAITQQVNSITDLAEQAQSFIGHINTSTHDLRHLTEELEASIHRFHVGNTTKLAKRSVKQLQRAT